MWSGPPATDRPGWRLRWSSSWRRKVATLKTAVVAVLLILAVVGTFDMRRRKQEASTAAATASAAEGRWRAAGAAERMQAVWAAVQAGTGWMVVLLEGQRSGNRAATLGPGGWTVAAAGALWLAAGPAVAVPLWLALHLMTSPVAQRFSGAYAQSVLVARPAAVYQLPVAFAGCVLVPVLLLALRAPAPLQGAAAAALAVSPVSSALVPAAVSYVLDLRGSRRSLFSRLRLPSVVPGALSVPALLSSISRPRKPSDANFDSPVSPAAKHLRVTQHLLFSLVGVCVAAQVSLALLSLPPAIVPGTALSAFPRHLADGLVAAAHVLPGLSPLHQDASARHPTASPVPGFNSTAATAAAAAAAADVAAQLTGLLADNVVRSLLVSLAALLLWACFLYRNATAGSPTAWGEPQPETLPTHAPPSSVAGRPGWSAKLGSGSASTGIARRADDINPRTAFSACAHPVLADARVGPVPSEKGFRGDAFAAGPRLGSWTRAAMLVLGWLLAGGPAAAVVVLLWERDSIVRFKAKRGM